MKEHIQAHKRKKIPRSKPGNSVVSIFSLVIFAADLEIRLRMRTNRTNLRSSRPYVNMTAVQANPYRLARPGKNFCLFDVG